MFIPIEDVIAPSARQQLIIQPTSLNAPPPLVPPRYRRMRKADDTKGKSQDELLQAEKSYQQTRHMAYLAVIEEAYRSFTTEG